ncbi:hypothetical protein H8B15_03000 [Hymenobacter sp. BT507]|uniref:Lipoprotein n=1 Tax=Hymenobacter citatus TaxID=2763506 RepID=A0ABR7MG13_9BACT|nr:hypothetical protein [Hymenobacter citatus]MBC6609873.1 hypothetical protein [Hymenobacter citatus]
MLHFLRLPVRLVGVALLSLLLLPACETSKRSFPEFGTPPSDNPEEDAARRRRTEGNTKLVAWASTKDDNVEYVVPRAQLATEFIRQFGDGTVVDRVTIRKVQDTPQDKAVYYVVGLGLRNGMFQAMAIPLQTSSDNSLYMTSNAARYIITSVGCTMCFFNFENSQITGTTCAENNGGGRCDLRVENGNTFFVRQ